MKAALAPIHLCDVVRVDETCFTFRCHESGLTIRHWASYLRDGDRLTIWDVDPPTDSECWSASHINSKGRAPVKEGSDT